MSDPIIYYLAIGLCVIAVVVIALDILFNKNNSKKILRVAAKMLNSKIQNSLINGSYVVGNYKNREITFSTVIKLPSDAASIVISPWILNRAVQISTSVNISNSLPENKLAEPTKNTYLDGNKVFYKIPELKTNWIGLKSGNLYDENNLPNMLDELVGAADMVEKSSF